jgi:hypothetical protein
MPIGRILCLGDGQTSGLEQSSGGYRSYRGELQRQIATAGYTVDFVGTQSSAPATGGSDGDHDGYIGARMRSADSSNSIESRIAAIRTAVGAVDIIVLLIGWEDVLAGTGSIGTKHTELLGLIQTGTWASARIVMPTLSPEAGKSTAQTGSDRPGYATLNTAIRGAASSTRVVADLAGLTANTAGERAAVVDKLIYDATHAPDSTLRQNGERVENPLGGHRITSWASIRDFNAQWRETTLRMGGNGNTTNDLATSPSVVGHPRFVNSVHAITPWFWVFAGEGHASSNTVVECRNLSAQALRASTNQWEFFYEGARPGFGNRWSSVWNPGSPDVISAARPDGITSFYRTSGRTHIENWATDTEPSRGIAEFYGGSNRSLLTDALCFVVLAQTRLALLDPNGPDDRARSRFLVACGFDAFAGGRPRYDYWGWPHEAMDGGNCRWQFLRSNDWIPVGSLSIGRTSPTWQGRNDEEHFEDPGVLPPIAAYSFAHPYNDIGTYSRTASQIRANPPRLPRFWTSTGSSGAAPAWATEDYWADSAGARVFLWSQQGAERAARAIYAAMLQAGWLETFVGGGGDPIAPSPLPGLSQAGQWAARFSDPATTPPTATWASLGPSNPVAPSWSRRGVAQPVAGAPYSAFVAALGEPAPTYSIVSGPAWLSINATTGELTGTAPTEPTESIVNLRASNGVAPDADLLLTLSVVVGAAILTTTLPAAIQGQPYLAPIEVTGPEPLTLTASGLPAGLALVGRNITGTPTNAAGGTVLLTLTPETGAPVTSTIVVAGGVASDLPTITTATLPDGTVGLSYSQPLAATGAGPITWSIASGTLPPGLAIAGSVVAGTPNAPGGYGVRLRATNALGVAERDITININAAGAVAPIASPWARWTRN